MCVRVRTYVRACVCARSLLPLTVRHYADTLISANCFAGQQHRLGRPCPCDWPPDEQLRLWLAARRWLTENDEELLLLSLTSRLPLSRSVSLSPPHPSLSLSLPHCKHPARASVVGVVLFGRCHLHRYSWQLFPPSATRSLPSMIQCAWVCILVFPLTLACMQFTPHQSKERGGNKWGCWCFPPTPGGLVFAVVSLGPFACWPSKRVGRCFVCAWRVTFLP